MPKGPTGPKTPISTRVHRKLRADQIDDLVSGYKKGGFTVYQLADQFNINRETFWAHFEETGRRHTTSEPAEQVAQASELYGEGSSLLRVAQELVVSRVAVNDALRAAGIELRPRRGWRYPLQS